MSTTRQTVTGSFDTLNTRIESKRTSCSGSWSVNETFLTYTGEQTVKTVISVDTPGFHALKKCGRFLPLNPFTVSEVKTTRYAGTGTSWHNYTGGCWRTKTEGPFYFNVTDAASVPEPDESIITAVANSSIAKVKSSIFDALTFMVEIGKTADLVASNWHRVNNFAMLAARRARSFRRNPGDVHKAFFEYWLEYRYGWTPLINESLDAVKALGAAVKRGDILDGKSYQSESLTTSDTSTDVTSSGTAVTSTTIQGQRRYNGMAYGQVLNSSISRFGTDPFVTIYEVIPYSFMVDRFIDFGSYIQSISPFSGAKLLGSAVGVRDSYTIDTVWNKTYSGAYSGSLNGIRRTVEVESYTRFPHDGGLPGWNPRITAETVVDIVGLVFLGSRRVRRLLSAN